MPFRSRAIRLLTTARGLISTRAIYFAAPHERGRHKENARGGADGRGVGRYTRVRRQQLQDQQNRMRGSIVKDIADQVVRIAKGQNFTLVFDSSGSSMNGTPVLIYFEDRMDITPDIIRELNKNQPPPELKSPAPK